eukprot:2984243-Prymnesium_polylepis.1
MRSTTPQRGREDAKRRVGGSGVGHGRSRCGAAHSSCEMPRFCSPAFDSRKVFRLLTWAS